ncbi:MAG TPA: hypothetical protein VGU02_13915 [Gaiellaceae bacterium]|nr:hypothetical protein [Gaiellaceae bacterium]
MAIAATPAPTGLKGHVTIGPLTPVCQAGTPCAGPAKRVTLSFVRNGVVSKRVVTDDSGAYRVVLRYGPYSVRASRGMSIRPARVWAHRGLVAKLNFAIDTGIR